MYHFKKSTLVFEAKTEALGVNHFHTQIDQGAENGPLIWLLSSEKLKVHEQ